MLRQHDPKLKILVTGAAKRPFTALERRVRIMYYNRLLRISTAY
jgi:hypothetical protein